MSASMKTLWPMAAYSLRTRQVMLDCLDSVALTPGATEDMYFTQAVRTIGGHMPDLETATHFSVESLYTVHPIGVHGTDKYYHSLDVAQKIVRETRY